jgi:uncharacterized protein (TIRG00374 family)
MNRLRRFVPVVISLILLVILASYAPWDKIGGILSDFDLGTILILIGLSLAYYSLKTVRFWYLLKAMGINQQFGVVALSYISAQPVTLLPAGEVYRSHSLERHTGVPVRDSLPQFAMQGVLEGAAMATLAGISALALGTLRIPVLILAVVVLLVTIAIGRGYVANFTRILNRLPFVNVTNRNIEQFSDRHRAVLSLHWLPFLYALSLVTEVLGAAIAYTAVVGLGAHINVYQAVLVYVLPIVVGFISFLPGGFGVSEQSAVGILLLANVSVAHAVASTLTMRVTIVGLGVLYGGVAMLFSRTRLRQRAAHKSAPGH